MIIVTHIFSPFRAFSPRQLLDGLGRVFGVGPNGSALFHVLSVVRTRLQDELNRLAPITAKQSQADGMRGNFRGAKTLE